MTDLEPSLSERAVARIAATLDRSRPKRRSFLAGMVVTGSALALKPWGFLVEDAEAYDVVCGQGNECSDGWTAFCCTVTGKNACPPGSFAAGWWKADNSGFCCGSARYYIDCNAMCGSAGSQWQCHCASGTCDRRAVSCNHFRYGQCHQEIACYGNVVCRVVTCQPPWQWDAACTSLSLTDNRTATHSAPCLGKDCGGPVEDLWNSLGGAAGVLGAKTSSEHATPPRGFRTLYANGAIYRNGNTVYEVHGSIWNLYRSMGSHTGALGYPRSNTTTASDGVTRISTFDNGAIIARPGQGTFEVHGSIHTKWRSMGSEQILGYPIRNTETGNDGKTQFSMFERGAIFSRPGKGTFETHGDIHDRWRVVDGPSLLGYPIGDTGTDAAGRRFSSFDRGRIVYDPTIKTTRVIQRSFKGAPGDS